MLGVVLLLMVGALLTADRALSAASAEAAGIDASESGNFIQQRIIRDVEGLGNFRALLLTSARDRTAEFDALAESFGREHDGVKSLWVADSTGRILFGSGSPPVKKALGNTVQIWPTRDSAAPDLVFLVPYLAGGRLLGSIGARFDRGRLFTPITDSAPATRARLLLVDSVGHDTILDIGTIPEASNVIWRH